MAKLLFSSLAAKTMASQLKPQLGSCPCSSSQAANSMFPWHAAATSAVPQPMTSLICALRSKP